MYNSSTSDKFEHYRGELVYWSYSIFTGLDGCGSQFSFYEGVLGLHVEKAKAPKSHSIICSNSITLGPELYEPTTCKTTLRAFPWFPKQSGLDAFGSLEHRPLLRFGSPGGVALELSIID